MESEDRGWPDATRDGKTSADLTDNDFAKIVREHSSRVYNAIYCVLGNGADAEDVAQEVFLKAYKALPGFKADSNISTWLYRIAMNAASDHIRKNGRNARLREPLYAADLELLGHASGAYENPESFYFKKELSETIQKELSKLPAKYRKVIVLKEIEGYSYKDIGKILGVSIGTVESRLYRAREMLRNGMLNISGKLSVEDEAV
ncbi:MAG: sigma-70 family RNA polymerase sigma factor [bacterium]